MATRIDWTGLRKRSENIPDFIDQLFAAVRKHPEGQRAELLFEVLDDISPTIKPKVKRETEILVGRGTPPAKALHLATLVTLKNRRHRLFKWLFFVHFPETITHFIAKMGTLPTDDHKAKALVSFIAMTTKTEVKPYNQEQAIVRLRETGFPETFVQEAKDLRRRTADEIISEIKARVSRGEKEKAVVQDELEKVLFEYGLAYMMGQGVAKGPDFCFVAAALAIAAVSVTAAALISQSIVEEVEGRKAERMIKDAQNLAEKKIEAADTSSALLVQGQDLTEEELRRTAIAAVDASWPEAKRALIDVLRNTRNRATAKSQELDRFRELWSKNRIAAAVGAGSQEVLAQVAAAQTQRDMDIAAAKKKNVAIAAVSALVVAGGLGYLAHKN